MDIYAHSPRLQASGRVATRVWRTLIPPARESSEQRECLNEAGELSRSRSKKLTVHSGDSL